MFSYLVTRFGLLKSCCLEQSVFSLSKLVNIWKSRRHTKSCDVTAGVQQYRRVRPVVSFTVDFQFVSANDWCFYKQNYTDCIKKYTSECECFNPLNAELNPICYLLALLGAHHFLHVSRIRVKSLPLRLLMSYIYIYIYIYGAPIPYVSRSHTTTQHSR